MDVSLSPEVADLVRRKVASGLYPSTDDVIREALRLLDERDRLREEIALGIDQADRGELLDGPTFFDGLQGRLRSQADDAPPLK